MRPIASGVIAAAALVAGGWWLQRDGGPRQDLPAEVARPPIATPVAAPAAETRRDDDAAQQAFDQKAQGRQIRVAGRVRRLLSDDRDGSPHQRFIIVTDRGLSLLVAHNLDLAPRLDGLGVGDRVDVFGEYEWNNQGGVMHWTHDDPQGRHPAGYIEWRGRKYQ